MEVGARKPLPWRLWAMAVAVVAAAFVYFDLRTVRAPGQARRAMCMSNMQQVGLGLYFYADEHGEKFPPSLEALCVYDKSVSKFLMCPSLAYYRGLPRDARPGKPTFVSYCYVRDLGPESPPHFIVAFDEEFDHSSGESPQPEGGNALHVDGSVTWHRPSELSKKLAQQADEIAAQGGEMEVLRPSWSRYPLPPDVDAIEAAAGSTGWSPAAMIVACACVSLFLIALIAAVAKRWRDG